MNNFGIGGVNVHIMVEPNYKTETKDNLIIAEEIPRIINICGRTEESVKHLMDFIENNPKKVTRDFLALLGDTMKYQLNIKSAGFPFRGIGNGFLFILIIFLNLRFFDNKKNQ